MLAEIVLGVPAGQNPLIVAATFDGFESDTAFLTYVGHRKKIEQTVLDEHLQNYLESIESNPTEPRIPEFAFGMVSSALRRRRKAELEAQAAARAKEARDPGASAPKTKKRRLQPRTSRRRH